MAPVGCLGAASNNIDLLERNRRLLTSAAGSAFASSTLPPLWFGLQAAIHLTVECSSCEICRANILQKMSAEIRNWAVVAAAMEARGATNSDMYRRAKALAAGESDPMPTSYPAAPFSISAA